LVFHPFRDGDATPQPTFFSLELFRSCSPLSVTLSISQNAPLPPLNESNQMKFSGLALICTLLNANNAAAFAPSSTAFLSKTSPQNKLAPQILFAGPAWCSDVGIYEFTMGNDGSKLEKF